MAKKQEQIDVRKNLYVRGARQHNLKNVSVDIPRDQLTVITGVSGSGKSSLAFDTIYAEGQRRYVESLSAYARQFLEMLQKPDVDSIDGLSPAIAIEQKTTSKNPRSTVGTVTEIYDYLRLLYARAGIPYSPATGLPIESQTVSQMVDRIKAMPEGTKLMLLAPIVRGRKGEYRKELLDLRKKGFQRVKIDGHVMNLETPPELDRKITHDISVVVDRIVVQGDLGNRVADSIETALHLSDGLLLTEDVETNKVTVFSAKFACPVSGFTIEEIEPRLFSFNNPHGACPGCDGLGEKMAFDPALIVPDAKLSLAEGAIAPWKGISSAFYKQTLSGLTQFYKVDARTPWKDLPEKFQQVILHGSGEEEIPMVYDDAGRVYRTNKPFEGIIPNLERRLKSTESARARDDISLFQSSMPCPACHGQRLRPEALAVKIDGKTISDVTSMSIKETATWAAGLEKRLTPQQKEIAKRVLKEIRERLGFLIDVGLEYLTLGRRSGTLSGGESQRIRLASQIGSGLSGVLYVLDEPSIGLHQRDNERLLITLKKLRDLGNTVLVVEHDDDAMRSADYLIDMGPGAGMHGGKVVAQGTPAEVIANPASLTGQYLSGKKCVPLPAKRREAIGGKWMEIIGATENNLKNITARFPLGTFTCVTGVSGSGKSSLVIDTLFAALSHEMNGAHAQPGAYKAIKGKTYIDKVIDIDQSPIGRTPRSNPATYTGAFTPIRDWFTGLPESKARGYDAGRFSFNVKGGRCEACEGDGVLKIEMHFLPDVFVTCDKCHGKRYNRETLEVHYNGKSIYDILDMTVEEGATFFAAVPAIHEKLLMLKEVGLDYIKIGQSATTLSGGEAQRIKLAKELARRATGRTLYILDEPTTGLHAHDVKKLLEVLHALVDQGNTVLVIEHNIDVIKTADYVIDIGPEGGDAGGEVVASGTPEEVMHVKKSYTGKYLKAHMERTHGVAGAKG